jgi:hypothetical protein
VILVDRTRHLAGLQFCPRARFWEYEYEGRGIRPKGLNIPPATGKATHRALEPLLIFTQETGQFPPRLEARRLILGAVEEYRKEAGEAGLLNGTGPEAMHPTEEQQYLIAEQSALVEGLGWAFWRTVLPFIQREFEIVAIEREVNYVLGCDCGLGDGTVGKVTWDPEEFQTPDRAQKLLKHEGRDCRGVAVMIRPDLVTRQLSSGAIGVWDFKTSSSDRPPRELDHLVQMALGVVGAGEIAGETCTHHYLIGLHKGQRRADKGQTLKKQGSPFCYLYHKPADPPYGGPEYQAGYTRKKGWGKVPVWELRFPEQDREEPGASPIEHWAVDMMGAEEVAAQCSLTGPTGSPVHLNPAILREVEAEARYWEDVMAAVREDGEGLDTYVRRSWDCYPFGEPCSFLRICSGDPGLERDPVGSDRFTWREPHHALEVEVQG